MDIKKEIKVLEKEIRSIDIVLYVLLFFTLGQILLTSFGLIDLNLLSLLTVGGSIMLFKHHTRKRNKAKAMMKLYEALDDPDAFEEKYLKNK